MYLIQRRHPLGRENVRQLSAVGKGGKEEQEEVTGRSSGETAPGR